MDTKKASKIICGAKRKNGNGQVCQLPPAKGRTRCRFHGGHSPVGMASATWKTGRYSKYFPIGLRKKYEAFLNDPLSLGMANEIATCDTHMTELLTDLANATKENQPTENIWHRILSCMEARRRLVESQRKYEVDMGQMLSAEKALELITALGTIIKEESERFIQDTQAHHAFCLSVSEKFSALIRGGSQADCKISKNF